MNSENKTFEEIMQNITNLTSDNYEETVKSMILHFDEDERIELYDAFIKEMKYNLINNEIYNNEELLSENIGTITNDLVDLDPFFVNILIENNFNLESIKDERKMIHDEKKLTEEPADESPENFEEANDEAYENTIIENTEEINTEEVLEEPREIEKINERIKALSRKYIGLFKKEMLLFELNEKIDNINATIKNEKENLTVSDEEIQSIAKERIGLFEKQLEEIEEEIKTINEKYEKLSNTDINLILQANDINYEAFKETIKTSMSEGKILNYEAYKLNLEKNKLEEDLSNIIFEVDKKTYEQYQKDTPNALYLFENISDENLEDELEILRAEKKEVWSTEEDSISNNINQKNEVKNAFEVLSEVDNIVDKISIIETVLKIRDLDKKINDIINDQSIELAELNNLKITRNAYMEIINDYELKSRNNTNEKNIDKSIDEYLNNHRRIEKINSYENSEKLRKELIDEIKDNQKTEQLFVEKTEKNGKLWLKALAATAGFASGLAMSCVPGVGTIRMGISAAKLAGSAINLWTKKHPNGKIAKVKNNINDKLNDKFPRIMENANKMRAKLKQTPLNCFVNGVAAGYITGNIIEKLTGQTVFENIKNMFETEEVPGPILSPEEPIITPEPTPDVEVEVPEQTPIVNDPSINETIKPEPLPGIEDFPPINEDIIEAFIPKEGQVYDLSALAEGLVSSDATKSVGLMRSLGKEVVFDKAVQLPDGKIMWHFKQLNGAGYAWFNSTDVQEIMTKASDVVSKTM